MVSASTPLSAIKRRSQRIRDQRESHKTHHERDQVIGQNDHPTTFNFARIPAAAPSLGEVRMLLESPRKWTLKHLEVAKLKLLDNVLPADIAGDFVPKDGDAGISTSH